MEDTVLLQKCIQTVRKVFPNARLEFDGGLVYVQDGNNRRISEYRTTHLKAWRSAVIFLDSGGI